MTEMKFTDMILLETFYVNADIDVNTFENVKNHCFKQLSYAAQTTGHRKLFAKMNRTFWYISGNAH